MKTKEKVIVLSVSDWNSDHNCPVIQIDFDCEGGRQCYQACVDSIEHGEIMKEEICKTLLSPTHTAEDFNLLVGRKIYILRAFPYHWVSIEGLRNYSETRTFTKTGFRKRHLNDSKTALDYQRESREGAIASAQRRIYSEIEGIVKDELNFVDWEKKGE